MSTEEAGATRDNWSGRFGFVLAAAGSAIGLGNLWKFPYITWQNEGGAFVLVYLVCITVVGLPIMCSEILIGRRAKAGVATAAGDLGFPKWNVIGLVGVAAGVVILGFYAVIAGWSLRSFILCMNWSFNGYDEEAPKKFDAFLSNGPQQLGLTVIFSVATSLIVIKGISGGIERAAKILMPSLLVILCYLLFAVSRMSGFEQANAFIFKPDFSTLTTQGLLEALGHSFFTLSLGMGCMITYGSYMKSKEKIVPVSITVVVLDTIIAIVACIIMYTIIFSVDGLVERVAASKGSTVGMLFKVLPEMFYNHMPGGRVVGPLFYVLVAFAALSSTISLLEVVVSLFVDKFKLPRKKATITAASGVFLISVLCALSLGASKSLSSFSLFGNSEEGLLHALSVTFTGSKSGVFPILDHLAANWLLPIGGLLITLFAGWVLPKKDTLNELFPGKDTPPFFFNAWLFFARFVAPGAIAWIIVRIVFFREDFS